MINWAKKQNPKGRVSNNKMLEDIGEFWRDTHCPLCLKYASRRCTRCPISKKFGVCTPLSEDNLWGSVSKSKTWKTWVKNAIEFRKQIKSLLKKPSKK